MQKAIFIGLDGAQLDTLRSLTGAYEADEILGLDLIEAYAGGETGTPTQQATSSGPGWSTLLSGQWVDVHGIPTNNNMPIAAGVNSIFELVDANIPDAKLASIVNWSPINTGHFAPETGADGSTPIVDFVTSGVNDATVTQTVVDLIAAEAPDFTFVHLDEPDGASHSQGYSDAYNQSLTTASDQVGAILAAVAERQAANPDEDWLVIVSTDHGRTSPGGFGHGGQSASEKQIFIAANKDLGTFDSAVPQTSIVPTILDHLGIAYDSGDFASGSVLEGAGDPFLPSIVEFVGPTDDAADVAVDSALVARFSEDVQAGTGMIRLHSAEDGAVLQEIDVTSDAVSFDGAVMTITPPDALPALSSLYVTIDSGAVTSVPAEGETAQDFRGISLPTAWNFSTEIGGDLRNVFSEDWESLAGSLKPFESPTEGGGDGTDWTGDAPEGWTLVNNSPVGGPVEFFGWTFLDKNSWISTAGDQDRSSYSLGEGVVAVADPDEYDDGVEVEPNLFNASMISPEIDISGAAAGSLILSFDSSWLDYGAQEVNLTVSFDGGEPVELLNWNSTSGSPNYKPGATNERVVLMLENPEGASTMQLSFNMPAAGNDWWWAVDNISVDELLSPNTAPEGAEDSYALEEGASLSVDAASGVLANDVDADGDMLMAALVDDVTNGTLTLNEDGSFEYQPDAGFYGTDSFTYALSDGTETAGPVMVSLTINEGTDPDMMLEGGRDDDLLVGMRGNDTLEGDRGDDVLQGDRGDDELDGGRGNDAMDGGDGNDSLIGDRGVDLMLGGDGDDHLDGGRDDDMMDGGAGNDSLIGDRGDDVLIGGEGDDMLTGGRNDDVFLFAGAFGNDVVTDWEKGDILQFVSATAADLSLSLVGTGDESSLRIDVETEETMGSLVIVNAAGLNLDDLAFV